MSIKRWRLHRRYIAVVILFSSLAAAFVLCNTAEYYSQSEIIQTRLVSCNNEGTVTRLRNILTKLPLVAQAFLSSSSTNKSDNMFYPLTTNAWELQKLLEMGKITSVRLVECYLDQINRHNCQGMNLRAMMAVAPIDDLMKIARALDDERRSKGARGPLHGIPVIIKDCYNTPSMSLDTTCGTTALKGTRAIEDAAIVKRIIRAGMIVLGKTNLSELGNMKGKLNTAGWSAAGGQTKSPYVRGDVLPNATFLGHSTPSGSSSGSCAGVAAGFAPVAFGVEAEGSVVQPASRAALYALKTTPGLTDMSGICHCNPDLDAPGVMSKSAIDVVNLWNSVLGPQNPLDLSKDDHLWSELKVGFVNGEEWQPADFVTEPNEDFKKQSIREMNTLADRIEALGARVVRNTALPMVPTDFDSIIGQKFAAAIESYLGLFHDAPIRNISDMIRWNLQHADEELPKEHPSQAQLESYNSSPMPAEEYDSTFQSIRRNMITELTGLLKENDIDVIFAPSDSRICSVAASAGLPIANVPLGYADFNGRAHGLSVLARPEREHDLLRVMLAWEAAFPELRQPPPMLVHSQ